MQLRALWRGWLEVLSQTMLLGMLLIPTLGLLYPLALVWPELLNALWTDRARVLLALLPCLLAALSLHLLGSWRWLLLHSGQSRPFLRFPLGRHLLWLGLGSLLAGSLCLLGASLPVFGLQPYGLGLPAFALGLSLAMLAGRSLPALRPLGGLALGSALLLAGCLRSLPVVPLLGIALLLASLALLPGLARGLPPTDHAASRPWALLGAVAVLGALSLGSCFAWLRMSLRAQQARFAPAIAAQRASLRLERPQLRPPVRAGNGFEAYWALVGGKCTLSGSQVPKTFPTLDSDRVRQMFDLETGVMVPDPELLARYAPELDRLEQAVRHPYMQYPFTAYERHCNTEMPGPHIGSMQDLLLLQIARGLASCNAGDCALGARQILDAARALQDLPVSGAIVKVMVAYKVERILLSAFGTRLRPEDLSQPQWRALLAEWRALLAAEHGLFEPVLRQEMLSAQLTMFDVIPEGLEAWPQDPVDLLTELAILPLLGPGARDLERLSRLAQDYLARPVHDPARMRRVIALEHHLARHNVFANTVLIDVVLAIYRFREHQVMLRGFYQHLALQAYAAAHGRYPDSLSALVPAWLPELPTDPYTGKAFVYRREGDDFRLYSQGENQRDDGGDGFYGNFLRSSTCSGQEMVFANLPPERCRR